jgi:uncharacterized paraquat-inducible protein A
MATDENYRQHVAKLRGGDTPTPGWLTKATTFAKAATKHVLHGLPTVEPEEAERRLAICRDCDKYNAAAGTCRICGCNLKTKASWALERCPIRKW